MPNPPFPLSYLPESVIKRLKDYAYNNPQADVRMPGSMLPGSTKNPFVTPYAGPPQYEDGFELVPENAIPLSQYKVQNIPKLNQKITDLQETPLPIINPDYIKPEEIEYEPFTGLPVKTQFNQNNLPDFGLTTEPQVNLDIFPYKDDVEYIRSQRTEEPEITLPPKTNNLRESAQNWMGGLFDSNNNNTGITEETQTPKNKFGVPESYYIGKSLLDATALINNMVQPQPPSIQMKIPHYERQKLNPEPYDAMRSQIRDQGTQAYRLQRENISQASDLMKGLAAVTSGTQQGLMQVGMQQAGAEQQIQGINQQISMQEQGQQTEMLNQEAMTNYQIQQQAQQFKDQMISAQLNRLGDTAGAYSDYVVKKELAQKMTDLSKEQSDKGNAIQIAMLKYQAGQNELNSDAYKEAQRQNINQYISETKNNLYKDPKYDKIRQKYGDNYDPLTLDTREANIKNLEQRMNILSESYNGFTEEPQKPTRTATMTDDQWKATEEDYEKRKWRFDSDKERYTIAKQQYDIEKPIIDLERSFVNELKSSYDIAGKRNDFQSEWFKKRGLKTMQETIEEVETLMNPNRQIFK